MFTFLLALLLIQIKLNLERTLNNKSNWNTDNKSSHVTSSLILFKILLYAPVEYSGILTKYQVLEESIQISIHTFLCSHIEQVKSVFRNKFIELFLFCFL